MKNQAQLQTAVGVVVPMARWWLLLSGTGTEVSAVIELLKIGERRVAKVASKDGTVKLGLPWVAEGKVIACCSGKAPPEAEKVAVCWDKLGNGVGTPQKLIVVPW